MDYEKEYKNRLDAARYWHSNSEGDIPAVLEDIFPELRESEDDRIRKCLITIIKIQKEGSFGLECNHGASWNEMLSWLEKQGKEISWKPSKEEMDVLYGLAYITNQYDEHKEEVIMHLYQDLKREFFNGSSYENMFPNTEDGVRRRSTIQVLEYAKSLGKYNQYGKGDIDKNIAWLEKQEGCEYIKKDWLEHIKQSWYKEGFIDGKYSGETSKEWTINDAATLKELIDFLENGTAKLQHDLTRYANWLKIQFTPIAKQGEQTDKIVERAKTEKQRVLITESDGEANIDWDTRSLQDVKLLLEYGLDYINKLDEKNCLSNTKPSMGDLKIISSLKDIIHTYWNNLPDSALEENEVAESCYRWLEKQCEQNLVNKVEPKFHKGD